MKKLLVLLFMACSFTAIAETDNSQASSPSVTECEDGYQGNRSAGKSIEQTSSDEETETNGSSGDNQ